MGISATGQGTISIDSYAKTIVKAYDTNGDHRIKLVDDVDQTGRDSSAETDRSWQQVTMSRNQFGATKIRSVVTSWVDASKFFEAVASDDRSGRYADHASVADVRRAVQQFSHDGRNVTPAEQRTFLEAAAKLIEAGRDDRKHVVGKAALVHGLVLPTR